VTPSERHQFKKCYLLSGENALSVDVAISGKQKTISLCALPSQLQQVLQKTFSSKASDVVLSVQHVHLDCTSLHVSELYVIDVTDEEIPVFILMSNSLLSMTVCGLYVDYCALLWHITN
jgi:hypothetical protein